MDGQPMCVRVIVMTAISRVLSCDLPPLCSHSRRNSCLKALDLQTIDEEIEDHKGIGAPSEVTVLTGDKFPTQAPA